MTIRGRKSTPAVLATCSPVAIFAAGAAMAAPAPNCPTKLGSGGIPVQTIQIYNDTAQNLYAEFEVGLNDKRDMWIQDICNVPEADKDTLYPYRTTRTNRFYINGLDGIPPGGSVTIRLPLYTQLVKVVDPKQDNQFAEWWQGQNIQIFQNPVGAGAPDMFKAYFNGKARTRESGSQQAMTFGADAPTKPTCTPGGQLKSCTLKFVTDTNGTLPKYGPSQLVEATLGAHQGKRPKPTDGSNLTFLYPTQADFDISYVNVAEAAATMGPIDNDQAGYVGSPMKPVEFRTLLKKFQSLTSWPTFIDLDGPLDQNTGRALPTSKLPSPLEILGRLSGPTAPADLPPLDKKNEEEWPTKVWKPIQTLRDNWAVWKDRCNHSAAGFTTFCDALLDVKALIHQNYLDYVSKMKDGTCKGGASETVAETDALFISHVYGWTPWTETKSGTNGLGCAPADNLLANTKDYGSADKSYRRYAKVKTEFDNLNYGGPFGAPWSPAAPYTFNPWVEFIHGSPTGKKDPAKGNLGMPGVYSYSVDDAVGNLNVYAKGYIVDVGSVEHQENKEPAGPPISIGLGYAVEDAVKFTDYSVCGPNKRRPVNPADPQFIISAVHPESCDVWLTDNKSKSYTFTVKPTQTKPPMFTLIPTQDVAAKPSLAVWSNGIGYPEAGKNPTQYDTSSVIDCSKNTTKASRLWCCNRLAPVDGKGYGAGVFAYSQPEDPPTGHQLYDNHVVTATPPATEQGGTACSAGRP